MVDGEKESIRFLSAAESKGKDADLGSNSGNGIGLSPKMA